MITRTLRLLLLALVASLIAAPASHADRTAQLLFEDPAIAPGNSAEAPTVIPRWAALGAQWVRVQAYWNAVSPSPNSRTKPAGFNVANPNDPRYNWGDLDRAIQRVQNAGMRVLLTVHQFNPVWASTQPRRGRQGWKPSPALYAQWGTALARRYGSGISDYQAGSEPNQRFFLLPQTECTRQRVGRRLRTLCERASANIYRNLVRAVYPALKRADRGSRVHIGVLAPIGATGARAGNIAPLAFIRALGCLDDRYRRITVGGCRGFRAARGDLFDYHAYQVRERPDQATRNPNLAKLGDLRRLFGVIDRLTLRGRIIAPGRRFNLWIDEYGYETNPPDRRNGVSLATQSRHLQQSAYIAWATPRVKLISQYKWRDDARGLGFQTGLNFSFDFQGGAAKPSLGSFPHPFFIDTRRGRNRARIWGQVRPGGAHSVQVFRNGAPFLNLGTDGLGYFTAVRRLARGARLFYRYTFNGQTFQSDEFRVR